MQNKRFANIDLEEGEKSKNNLSGNCQERTYWISRKAQWGDLYFLLGLNLTGLKPYFIPKWSKSIPYLSLKRLECHTLWRGCTTPPPPRAIYLPKWRVTKTQFPRLSLSRKESVLVVKTPNFHFVGNKAEGIARAKKLLRRSRPILVARATQVFSNSTAERTDRRLWEREWNRPRQFSLALFSPCNIFLRVPFIENGTMQKNVLQFQQACLYWKFSFFPWCPFKGLKFLYHF